MASTITQFNHLRIPLEEVLKATNDFDEKNVVGHGDLGKVYRGRLWQSGKWVKIAARRLDAKHKRGIEFWTEISALSSFKHDNIVSIIGFCDEKDEKVIINKRVAKGSLAMHLSNPTLTWTQRLTICVGVARALRYIHNEDGHSYPVIHRNINSSTILLDNKFEAKLSGFEYSINYPVHRMDQVLFSEAIGTTGYMDPAIEKTGGVTHKSDIYSFGIVLWEILCGRKALIPNDDNRFLAPLAIFHYENKTLNDIIQPGLLDQIDRESLDSFSKVAYQCLKDERAERPDMNYIVHELEKLLERQLQYVKFLQQFSHLKIPLEDILEATNNFDEKNVIGRGEFGKAYKGMLLLSGKRVMIRARRSENKNEREYMRFRKEIYSLSCLEHQNIASIIGFCDEKNEKVIINKRYPKGSLSRHLSKPTLTWIQRLRICVGVARALSYIHNDDGRGYSIIHQYIGSGTILLDEDFEAKLSCFEYSFTKSVHQMDQAYNPESVASLGYEDPARKGDRVVTHKSDIYAFGVVLWEILCGRKAYIPNEGGSFLAPLARFHYKNKTLNDIILPSLQNQIAPESLNWFLIAAYSCIKKNRNKRPDMNDIIPKLERALECQMLYDNLLKDDQVRRQDIDPLVDTLEMNLTHEKSGQSHNAVESLSRNNRKDDQVQRQDIDRAGDSVEMNLTHEKSEQSIGPVESISWFNEKGNFLEHLAIPLSDIKLATDNFSLKCCTAFTIFDDLYIAELEHFDKVNFANVEAKNASELPKRRSTVCIKRFRHREDKEGENLFFTQLEMLTTCEHHNIVTLLGFCNEGSERILVIEHLSNGYLGDYLKDIKYRRILTWEARLKICVDIAHGLNYLHFEMENQKMIINRDIRSDAIGLDENWGAKIVDLGHSVLLPLNQDDGPLHVKYYARRGYLDPEYYKTEKLTRGLDVYSFGVVLLEIFCGKLAYDPNYTKENEDGLAYVARRCFHEGTLKEMVDPVVKEETGDENFTLKRGPNKESLNAFLDIAYECLNETQDRRPTMKIVVKELEKALLLQVNNKDNFRISLEDIQLATGYFHVDNCVGGGGFGKVYKGKLPNCDDIIVAKRLDTSGGQGEKQFRNELQILFEYKHENIIGFVGYCDEKDAKVIVYEYASRGSLDRYLKDTRLTWVKRLKICIEVATALEFLHGGAGTQATVIHRDIKTENILLTDDWHAKLADFGLSLISAINQETDYVIDRACGTLGYVDQLYLKSGFLTIESDIYAFGVVLFEILCGRTTFMIHRQEGVYLPDFIKDIFEKGKRDTVVFEDIKAQIMPEALSAFETIAYRCLNENREERPKAKEVVEQLKKALDLQVAAHGRQVNNTNNLRISLEDIQLATGYFHDDNCVGGGRFAKVYKGKLPKRDDTIVAKRLDTSGDEGEKQFRNELQILFEYKHENIIGFVGYCDEKDAKVIVYEYASRGSLDRYLNDTRLTWVKRLKICIEVATALEFLHEGAGTQATVIHRDIKTANILLNDGWNAKLADFGLSLISIINQETDYVIDRACGTLGYVDQLYLKLGFLTTESDIYAFGVVLYEILCGRTTFMIHKKEGVYLPDFIKDRFEKGKHDTVVFEDIKAQIMPEALSAFETIAYRCLNENRKERPKAKEVVEQLKKALDLQVTSDLQTNYDFVTAFLRMLKYVMYLIISKFIKTEQ